MTHGDEIVDKIEAMRNTRYYKSVGLSQSDPHPAVLPIRQVGVLAVARRDIKSAPALRNAKLNRLSLPWLLPLVGLSEVLRSFTAAVASSAPDSAPAMVHSARFRWRRSWEGLPPLRSRPWSWRPWLPWKILVWQSF